MHRLLRLVLTSCVVVFSACPGGPKPGPAPEADPNAATRLAGVLSKPCDAATTDAVIEALARAGIATIDDATQAKVREVLPPELGLHVTKAQARGMGCELANRGGLAGRDLDEMVGPLPLPDDAELPFSALLGAYVTAPSGPFGSQLSAALMGPVKANQHAQLVYPTLVVTLFAREVLVPMLSEAPAGSRKYTPRARRDALDVDPCGAISSTLDDLPAAASKAVGSLAPEEGGFWSSVVSVASVVAGVAGYATAEAARGVIRNLPFVSALRQAATAVSAVADLKAMFTQWTLTLTPKPGSVHKSVGAPNTGTLELEVKPPEEGFEWPQQVKSCAELLDVPLPDFNSANGADVAWTTLVGFASPATRKMADAQVAGGKAVFTYTTVQEDESVHLAAGAELSTPATVKADLALPGLEGLGSHLAGLMGAGLASDFVSGGSAVAATMLGPSTTGSATITFHASPATLDIEIVDDGTFKLHAVSCGGLEGPYTGTAQVIGDPSGMAPITPFSFDPTTKVGTLAVSIPMSGTCTGTYAVNGPMTLVTGVSPTVTVGAMVSGALQCPMIGTVPLSAPATGTFPLVVGPTSECP